MIDLDNRKNLAVYEDYEKCLEYLRNIPDIKRTSSVNFHIYSEINDAKQLMSVKSFFATQDLEHSQLILWSDYDIQDKECLKPYASRITFKVFDPMEEAKGTVLEGNQDILLAKDSRHYMMSGLLRFLVLHKYGGVWYDHDMILLRDFSPLLEQEFAYCWGSHIYDFSVHGPCAALMHMFKDSDLTKICMEELLKAPIKANTVSRDCEMLAEVYKRKNFCVLPTAFFNIEWIINFKTPGHGTEIEQGWFNKTGTSDRLFLECFAWHWHAGGGVGYQNTPIQEGSKFDLLTKYIDAKLR